jgi:hypothetical protein
LNPYALYIRGNIFNFCLKVSQIFFFVSVLGFPSSEFAFGSLRDVVCRFKKVYPPLQKGKITETISCTDHILKALAKARMALPKGLEACVRFSFSPPPPPTITISNSVHILKALNGAKGPVQRFRGLRALLKNPFTPPPKKKKEGGGLYFIINKLCSLFPFFPSFLADYPSKYL